MPQEHGRVVKETPSPGFSSGAAFRRPRKYSKASQTTSLDETPWMVKPYVLGQAAIETGLLRPGAGESPGRMDMSTPNRPPAVDAAEVSSEKKMLPVAEWLEAWDQPLIG